MINGLSIGMGFARQKDGLVPRSPGQAVRVVNRRVGSLPFRQSLGPKGRGSRFPAGSVVAFGRPEAGSLDGWRDLFPLFDAIDRSDLPTEEMFRAVAESLAAATGGAERMAARIVVDAVAVQTRTFTASPRKRAVPILVRSKAVGMVELHHRDGDPAVAETDGCGDLLESVARRLGLALERRQADRERDESRERYRRLMDLFPDAIVVYRAGRITDANAAAADLLAAVAADDLTGRPFLDFVHPEFRGRVAALLAGHVREGDNRRDVEVKLVRLDDGVIDAEMAWQSAVIGGEAFQQAVIRDVTREKREEALSQLGQLTPREYQVMRLVAAGETSKAIALRLGLSPKTVEVHRANVMRKMGVKTLADLIRKKAMVGVP